MERLEADLPRAVNPGVTATEAITVVAVARASDRWHMARGWLCARKPADAVRELLAAADPLLAWLRDAAARMAAMTGEDGLPGWHAIAGNATAWPSSARLARDELRVWGHAPEPSPADCGWLGVEAAAAALLARGEAWPEGQGADEARALTAQAVDLKVTLWRSSPPLWRTVRMPLAATLGDLHRTIQVLFDWDGDHRTPSPSRAPATATRSSP
jgi:hypothetical protein